MLQRGQVKTNALALRLRLQRLQRASDRRSRYTVRPLPTAAGRNVNQPKKFGRKVSSSNAASSSARAAQTTVGTHTPPRGRSKCSHSQVAAALRRAAAKNATAGPPSPAQNCSEANNTSTPSNRAARSSDRLKISPHPPAESRATGRDAARALQAAAEKAR